MPRDVVQLEVTKDELQSYARELHLQRQTGDRHPPLNLNQFIKARRRLVDDERVVYQASLGGVRAEAGEVIDLAGGDLSFVNFGKGNFSHENWIFSGFKQDGVVKQVTNLQGATLSEECKFHGISFEGSDWGKRVITHEQFEQCSFKGANYDPTHPVVEGLSTQLITKVKVSKAQLKAYLDALHSDPTPEHARGSLADFLEYELLPYCSDNTKIVPDISGLVIDGAEFNLEGANFSGSILSELVFSKSGDEFDDDNKAVEFVNVKAENLTMRDCIGFGARFEECEIGTLDLRGTDVSDMYFGEVTYNQGADQEVTKKATKIQKATVTAIAENLSEHCAEYTEDQCYVRRQSSLDVNESGQVVAREIKPQIYIECSIEDIKAFAAANFGPTGKNFREFLRERHNIVEKDFIPDAKGLNLDELNLSNCNWGRCCFDSCSMVKTNWESSVLEGSYFGNCKFSGRGVGIFAEAFHTSFRSTKLKDAIFDSTEGKYADFSYADMDLVSAIGADFDHGIFTKAKARMAMFSSVTMTRARADYLDMTGSDISSGFFEGIRMRHGVADHVNADGALFDQGNIAGISFMFASANGASMVGANADGANMTGTRLWAGIDKLKLRAMKFDLDCSEPPEDITKMKDKTIYLFVAGDPAKLQYKAKDHKGDVIEGDFANENPSLLQRYVTGNKFEKITNKLQEGRRLSSGEIELILTVAAKRGLQVAAVLNNVDMSSAEWSKGFFGGSPRIDRFTQLEGMMDSAVKFELKLDQAIIKSIPTMLEDFYFVAKSLDTALKMTSLAKFAHCTQAVQVAGKLLEDKWKAGACVVGTPVVAFAVMGWAAAAIDITGGAAAFMMMSAISPFVVVAGFIGGGILAMKLVGAGIEPKEVIAAKEQQAAYAKLHPEAPELDHQQKKALKASRDIVRQLPPEQVVVAELGTHVQMVEEATGRGKSGHSRT